VAEDFRVCKVATGRALARRGCSRFDRERPPRFRRTSRCTPTAASHRTSRSGRRDDRAAPVGGVITRGTATATGSANGRHPAHASMTS